MILLIYFEKKYFNHKLQILVRNFQILNQLIQYFQK